MITYEEGKWSALFSLKGSVLPKAAKWAVPVASLAAACSWFFRTYTDSDFKEWFHTMKVSDRLRDFSFVLGFLIVFRVQTAYGRWWEAGTLLQQLRGEWFNSFSSLLAFCNADPEKQAEVEEFQHILVRLFCLLYANALTQVSAMEDNAFELISIEGFDVDSLEEMIKAHDSCELVVQWIQRLIVEANSKSLIKVAPPILSRVYDQLGKGIVRLNNARKIRQFPIPFPLAQMVAVMLIIHLVVTIVVMAGTVSSEVVSFGFTFVIVLAFWSTHFIAIELEQPYGDDPNDLPLHEMMMDLNKSLCGLLKPIVLSPPQYDYDPDRARRLETSKTDIQTHLASQKANGRGRRRVNLLEFE